MRWATLGALLALFALSNAFVLERSPRIRRDTELHDWLNEDQKSAITELKNAGSYEDMKKKITEYYDALPEETRKVWDEKYKADCVAWIKTVASAEEVAELKALHESGNTNAVETKVTEYRERLDADARKSVDLWEPECRALWAPKSRRVRNSPVFQDFTHWMTEEQRSELSADKAAGKSFEELREKTLTFLGKLPADKQTEIKEAAKGKCTAYFSKLSNEAELAEMKSLHEAGQHTEVKSLVDKVIDRQEGTVKEEALKYQQVCIDVFGQPRRRKDINTLMDKHLSWLDETQKEEIREMKAAGKSNAEIKEKVMSFLHNLDGEKKVQTKEKLKASCYAWLNKAASKEEVDELHKLHETDHNACKTKVREYIKRLPAAEQEDVNKSLPFCERIWYGDHDHHGHGHHHKLRRRDQHHSHSLEEALDKYLTWLSDGQKDELKALQEKGEKEGIYLKVLEFYDASAGEAKEKATEQLKDGCKHYIKHAVGDEKAAELKKLHESGASVDQMHVKVLELVETIADEAAKERARMTVAGCKKIFSAPSRRRRDEETMEQKIQKYKEYLSWLTEEQTEELKTVTDRESAYKKILEFFAATSGEVKEKATEQLKGACKHVIGGMIGSEKSAELKKLKESGASKDQMIEKVNQFVGEIADAGTKAKAEKAVESCKKIFEGSAGRRRRDHHLHSHDFHHTMEKYLSWLSDEQLAAVRALKEDKPEMYKKVMEFFDAAEGDTKEKATTDLKGACKHFVKHTFGDEKAQELKNLKESGASATEIADKIAEYISGITDVTKKAAAEGALFDCKKVFGVLDRKRRDHHHHTLENALGSFLDWLSEEQKEELKDLKDDKEALYKKVIEYFDSASDDVKPAAAEKLKGACRHMIKDVIGEEKATELKKLKDSGASVDEMEAKVKSFLSEVEDADKRSRAERATDACKKVFSYKTASRKRRHENHSLEEALTTFLDWLTDEQKEVLTALKDDKEAVHKKVEEFFAAASDELKPKAAQKLGAECKHLLQDAIGVEKESSLKAMKESGATFEELSAKVEEYLKETADSEAKTRVLRAKDGCGKVFKYTTTLSRKRRHEHHTLEEALTTFLDWLTDEQKDALKALKDDKAAVYKKVEEFFAAASDELKPKAAQKLTAECRHLLTDAIGAEKESSLKTMKDSGATYEELGAKVEEYLKETADSEAKTRVLRAKDGCHKVFKYTMAASRKRRDHHHVHTLDEALEKVLDWLSADQKAALKEIKDDKEAVLKKVEEFFAAAPEDVKPSAAEKMKGACRHLMTDIIGEEKAAEIKKLKESGASFDQIEAKAEEYLAAAPDSELKKKVLKAKESCKRIFKYKSASRRRRDHHHHEHTLEEALDKVLDWLSEDQKAALKAIKDDKEAVIKKVEEFFKSAPEDVKPAAAEKLKGACRHLMTDLIGEEKAAEMKKLRESGASFDQLEAKAEEFFSAVPESELKNKVMQAKPACKKIFKWKAAS